nr:hypothetical protein [uncultured Acetatifactor sp.]
MGYKEEYEQEIDLKDMLFHILYRWRSILLAMILVGVAAIGYVVVYNLITLPGERAEVRGEMQEQMRVLEELEGVEAEQQDAAAITEVKDRIQLLDEQLGELQNLSPVKYGAIGIAVGLFGMMFLYGIAYVLSDKLRGERELLERYGYHLLGTFPRRRKGKALTGFDHVLEKKEGGSGQAAEEETYGIISANITNLAKDGGLFLMTGTVDIGKLQRLTKAILPMLQKNVMLAVGADMNRTASTVESLGECDAVILVEERGTSLRGGIQKEHENIAALEKPVIGYIVL